MAQRLTGTAMLEFNPELNKLSKGKALQDGLSAVVRIGETLWVANDETISLERLTLRKRSASGGLRYGDHEQYALSDYVRLPVPPPSRLKDQQDLEEVDVEGLDYCDGYLWLVGSHSLKRKKPGENESVKKSFKRLAKVAADGNRFLLARIPVEESGGTWALQKEAEKEGKKRIAAQLRGNHKGNDLTASLAKDRHLRSFLSGIPGKENGFDVEGLAVAGQRVFLGLRGPVLRGWAVILELDTKKAKDDPSTLELKKIGPGGQLYRKHFLSLAGLGIRDLCVQGSDLLILAGPTMDLDGPIKVFRWPGGALRRGESLVPAGELSTVLDLPFGRGTDRAEGMTLFFSDGREARSVLVVYDSASNKRKEGSAVKADIFGLP